MAKDFVKLSKEWFDKQAPVYDETDTILYSKYGKKIELIDDIEVSHVGCEYGEFDKK